MTDGKLERSGSSQKRIRRLPNQLLQYGVALLSVALALGVTFLLANHLEATPTLLFFVAVMVSAWFGGFKPAIAATVLSTLTLNYFLLEPRYSFNIPNLGTVVQLGVFIMTALLTSSLNEAQRIARRKAEASFKSLRESEARYQVLVSNMPGMVYCYAPAKNGRAAFTYVSAGSCELVELEPKTILQDPDSFLRLIHPDDLPSFQESVAVSVANSALWQWEGRLITPSGQLKWVQGRSRPQHTEYGEAWDGLFIDITDRKQAEEALRQSEERLRVALKNSPITVFNQDQNLRHTWVYNPTISLEPTEIIGKQDCDFLSEEDAAVLTQIKRRVLETGIGAREEIKLTMPEQVLYYDLTVEPLLNGNEETIGITCASINITERKQMELALRRSETTLSALIASSPIAIALCDRDLRYLHANEALANVNGIPLSEHIGRTFEEVLPEWAPVLTPILQQVMTTQEPVLNHEIVGVTHPPDVVRHALVNFFPVCLANGEVLGVGVTSIDISDRRRTEEALRQSETQYRAIYDQVIVGISQVDLTGKFLRVNERFCEITGRSPTELLNLHMQEIIHPDDLPYSLVLFDRMLEDGTSFEIEKRYVRPDSSEIWVRNYVSLLRNGNGQPWAGVAVTEDITEQKQAEAALSEQRHLLETILRYTANAIMVCDAYGKLTFVNPEARRLAQHDPQGTTLELELLDWGIPYNADGNQVPLENYAISKALRGEISNAVEARMIRTDGTYYDILISAAPLLNDGQIVGAVASFIDISDRKRVEDEREQVQHELQQILQTLRTLIQASPLPILVIELDLTVNLWNSAAERLFGWSEAEVIGRPLPIVPEEKQEECDQLVAAVMGGEVFFAVETYRCKRDGSHVILSVSAAPLYDDQGEVDAILLILQDITERQLAEKNLRDSEERLRLALMAANQGLYDLNILTGDIIVTPAYAQMLGYDPDEFQETIKNWRDRFHPDDVSVAHQAYQDYLTGKTDIYQVEFRQRTYSGDWKWILSIGRIVAFDEHGQPLRMLGTHTDITERKQAETEREQLLAREKMAREEAETANRIKDEFLAVLSHELRSPLNPILGWSKLLQTQKLSAEKTQQALSTIERNAKLQTQLIEDLLDVSRILRGKLALNITPVTLINTIDAALETVRLAVEAKEIDLRFETWRDGASINGERHPSLSSLQVMGDAARLQQVVWNLLTNAVKFTSVGGQVEVCLERVEIDEFGVNSQGVELSETSSNYPHTLTPSSPPNSTPASTQVPARSHAYAQITVRDTGRGIDPEFLPYVFDYFRQEDGTTTRKFGGLGLGLAIVRHITELHGGRVWVESPGQDLGATFTVQLPLISTAIAVDSLDETPTSADLNGLRVMAVDDDADIRTLLEFILEQAGAEVRVVSSALEVLQQLEAFSPEVLISDVGMPNFDGYMLIRQIRTFASPKCRAIPAIALTAYAGEGDQQQAIAAGFQMHLAKPVEPERLINAIVALLNEHRDNITSTDAENWTS